MQQQGQEILEGQAIFISVLILVVLSVILIVLFSVFQKRKNKLLIKQNETKKHFEREIAKTQIEIREETFRNISWELHDNIGQILTLAKIQLQNSTDKKGVILTLDKALKELRALSRSINPEALANSTLASVITTEIERLNRLDYIKAKLIEEGDYYQLDKDVEIVFFRMIQEFLSNTIKHAKATELLIKIIYSTNRLQIIAKDNGRGFEKNNTNYGMGIKNILKRAELINAIATITSEKNEGTELKIVYNLNTESHDMS